MTRTASDVHRLRKKAANATPGTCGRALTNVTFVLRSSGLASGATYLRPGARVTFHNVDSITHTITVSPVWMLKGHHFVVRPGWKVTTFASRPSQVAGGTIIDGSGPGRTVHDIVICP